MATSAESTGRVETEQDEDSRLHDKLAHRFMELFHGRFESSEAQQILLEHNWEIRSAVNFVFNNDYKKFFLLKTPGSPEDLRRHLGEQDNQQWQEVRNRNSRQRRRELAIRNEQIHQLAIRNIVPTEVSKCYRCRRRYECIPREMEWGWAKFVCRCNFVFYGFGAMGRTLCLCYQCNQEVWPDSIIPPEEQRERRRQGRRRNTHSCLGVNCYNRTVIPFNHPVMIDQSILQDLICVHPNSLERQVVEESDAHRSTGSTVDTFLTQDNLAAHDPLGVYLPSVPTVREEDNDGQ